MGATVNGEPTGRAPMPAASRPTWAPAAKDAVGCGLDAARVWFTCAQGILTEVYYPRIDIPQIRDMGLIVADGRGFWVELRRLGNYEISWAAGEVPAFHITHRHSRFVLDMRICPDPERDVVLVEFTLTAQDPALRPYVLLAPRLGGDAAANMAWCDTWNGSPLLWAEQGPFGLALLCRDVKGDDAFVRRSAGMTGASDLWQDFERNGAMTWSYAEAGPGEVALGGELPRAGTLALGFATSREAAATLARASLANGFAAAWERHCALWRAWQVTLPRLAAGRPGADDAMEGLLRRSAAVLKIHQDRTFPGAMTASLSVPWGDTSESRGGYHLVWSRDLVESAGALLALGALDDARRVLIYLLATQQADGHWLQNQWLGGKPFWQGIQLDETAFPVLLAAALADRDALAGVAVGDMARRALAFLLREGPCTSQDRWEEDGGINTFTLAVVIAALVEGARFLDSAGRDCALAVADNWNRLLEDWTWSGSTDLARAHGVDGYYLRIAPREVLVHAGAKHEALLIKNRAHASAPPADQQVATDFLQLCRYGLRAPDDPCITATVKVSDALLRSETPSGPVWHRYNGDGYGEHPDGAPFDGWGRGRGWPLLVGERGHYALLSGEDPASYLTAMMRMTGPGGLIPEQVWDEDPIPARGLAPGHPSGSAMPLVWAHAEFIKLVLSRESGAPVDRPAATWARYGGSRPVPETVIWTLRLRPETLRAGQALKFVLPEPALIHWGHDDWQDAVDIRTADCGIAHVASLAAAELTRFRSIEFTLDWPAEGRWQGQDFRIAIA